MVMESSGNSSDGIMEMGCYLTKVTHV